MLKFDRNYKIVFEIGTREANTPVITDKLEIAYPLSIDFNISRNLFSSINSMSATISGLKENSRAMLYQDKYDIKKYIGVSMYAGYGNEMPLIFKGVFKECYSFKESGGTVFKTYFEAFDGAMDIYTTRSNVTFAKGTDSNTILTTLSGDFKSVSLGGISPRVKIPATERAVTFSGKTYDLLSEYTNGNLFIDNERLYFALQDDTLRVGDIMVINSDSGLLSSPKRRENVIDCDFLFEPQIFVGQEVALLSENLPYLNQTYKVVGFTHEGTISGAFCGKLTTQIKLNIGAKTFNPMEV